MFIGKVVCKIIASEHSLHTKTMTKRCPATDVTVAKLPAGEGLTNNGE